MSSTDDVKGLDEVAAGSNANDDEQMTLLCADGTIQATRRVLKESKYIQNGMIVAPNSTEIDLKRLSLAQVTIVVKYCEEHAGKPAKKVPVPLPSNNLHEYLDDWDANFANGWSQDEMFGVLIAANFLEVHPLLMLGCAKLATMLKGRTPDEVRAEFNIPKPDWQVERNVRKYYGTGQDVALFPYKESADDEEFFKKAQAEAGAKADDSKTAP